MNEHEKDIRQVLENDRVWLDSMRVIVGQKPVCGLQELSKKIFGDHSIEYLTNLHYEKAEEFLTLCASRLIMGHLRYGSMDQGKVPKTLSPYHYIESVLYRLQQYEKEGNQENLIDAANLIMLEFAMPHNPKHYFEAIDDGTHTKKGGKENHEST